MCKENDIQVIFFKAPVSDWTRADSSAVKQFMDEYDLEYLELNDYLDVIGIDEQTDFANERHLNGSGAEKTTDFLGKYLLDRMGNQQ